MHQYLKEHNPEIDRYTDEMMYEMVEDYIAAETAAIEEERKRKRGKLSTRTQISVTDKSLFESNAGLDVPDLTDKINLIKFLGWDGQMQTIQGIKTKNMISKLITMSNETKTMTN
jgi:hypothetical protein